jgi:hypothetical protein
MSWYLIFVSVSSTWIPHPTTKYTKIGVTSDLLGFQVYLLPGCRPSVLPNYSFRPYVHQPGSVAVLANVYVTFSEHMKAGIRHDGRTEEVEE